MMQTLAVIGGGVSGAFVVLNCLKQAHTALEIIWFDGAGLFCKGLAYSTKEEVHLLNVRASNMSAFADEPAHFLNWLQANSYPFSGKDFVPRKLYGAYILDTFQQLKDKNPLVKVIQKTEEVSSVIYNKEHYTLTAKGIYTAHTVVLAVGNFLPAHPRSTTDAFTRSQNYYQNAFATDTISKISALKHITIFGAGLTMIDVVLALKHHHYKGHITIISPHGYLPQPHQEHLPAIENFINPNASYTLLQVLRLVNQQLKKAKRENANPHSVIDALRPYIQTLWLNFSIKEKQQFLRHLRHKWGVARHRAPLDSISVIHELMLNQQLSVLKGRISDIKENAGCFDITYANKFSSNNLLNTEAIVNCTGPESDFHKIDTGLIKQLIHSGLIEGHELHYGIKASKTGEVSKTLFAIGPPLKGVLWESTAVPEIRVQAAEITGKIIFD